MTKVRFHPIVEWFTGKMGQLVFRRSHNGKVSVYETPYMKKVKWSHAQKDQRQRMGEASRYASAAVADPDIRPIYVQMALDHGKNPKRPFDMAVSDYYHHGNDLLWKSIWAIRRNRRTGTCTITRGTLRNQKGGGNAERQQLVDC